MIELTLSVMLELEASDESDLRNETVQRKFAELVHERLDNEPIPGVKRVGVDFEFYSEGIRPYEAYGRCSAGAPPDLIKKTLP